MATKAPKPITAGRSRRGSAKNNPPSSIWPHRSKVRKSRLVEFTIYQNFQDGQHSLGRFRISVTNSKPPLNFGLTPAISAILAKPADKRTDAEREVLLAQLRAADKHVSRAPGRTHRAAAIAPERSDAYRNLKPSWPPPASRCRSIPSCNSMRRAIELSEEQLKNKRLTVAQDIVWALINNPAFLYNH